MRSVRILLWLATLWSAGTASAQSAPPAENSAPLTVPATEPRFDPAFRALGEGASDVPASTPGQFVPRRLQLAAGAGVGLGYARHAAELGGSLSSKRVTLLELQAAVQYALGPRSALRATANVVAGLGAEARQVEVPRETNPSGFVTEDFLPLGLLVDLEYSLRPGFGPVRLSLAARAGYVGETSSEIVSGSFVVGGMLGLAFLLGAAERYELHARGGAAFSPQGSGAGEHVDTLIIPLELSFQYRFF